MGRPPLQKQYYVMLGRYSQFLPVFEACMGLSMMSFYLSRALSALTECVVYFLSHLKKTNSRDFRRLPMLSGRCKKESGIRCARPALGVRLVNRICTCRAGTEMIAKASVAKPRLFLFFMTTLCSA